MKQTTVHRDENGRLHGHIAFAWNERRGPSIGGGTAAFGESMRLRPRPLRMTDVQVSLEADFVHGLCFGPWIWTETGKRLRAWVGSASLQPTAGDPLYVVPSGVWVAVFDHDDCEPLTRWSVGSFLGGKTGKGEIG